MGADKATAKPTQTGLSIEASVADFLDFIKRKRRPKTLSRYRSVMDHYYAFFKRYSVVTAVKPSDIDVFQG